MTDAAPQLRGELRKLSAADTEFAKVVSVLGGVAMIAGTTLAAVFQLMPLHVPILATPLAGWTIWQALRAGQRRRVRGVGVRCSRGLGRSNARSATSGCPGRHEGGLRPGQGRGGGGASGRASSAR